MKRSELYKALRDLAKEKMPDLKIIDLQKGQFGKQAQNYPVPLPALLIEIGDFRFSNLLEHRQKGDGVIGLYLYLDMVADTLNGAERESQTIEILDRQDELFEAFEGTVISPLATPLVRQTEYKPQYTPQRAVMLRTDFTTTIDDRKTIEPNVAAKPNVTFNFK
jgi:hypothetical protein